VDCIDERIGFGGRIGDMGMEYGLDFVGVAIVCGVEEKYRVSSLEESK